MSARARRGAEEPERGGDGRRLRWSESPIPRVASRRVRMVGVEVVVPNYVVSVNPSSYPDGDLIPFTGTAQTFDWVAGDVLIYATDICLDYGTVTVPTGWTAALNTGGEVVLWAPASVTALTSLYGTALRIGYDGGSEFLGAFSGVDDTTPIESMATLGATDGPVTARNRASITCTASTAQAINLNFGDSYFSDSVAGVGVDLSSIGTASVLVTTGPSSSAGGFTCDAIGEAAPGVSGPSWPTAQTLVNCGTSGDYHYNVSLALLAL